MGLLLLMHIRIAWYLMVQGARGYGLVAVSRRLVVLFGSMYLGRMDT